MYLTLSEAWILALGIPCLSLLVAIILDHLVEHRGAR